MKEINSATLSLVSGANGKDIAQLAGAAAGTWLSGGNPYAGMGAGWLSGEVYSGVQNGYSTAPGITQGLGSFNPNYSGRPMLCNPPAQTLGCPHY